MGQRCLDNDRKQQLFERFGFTPFTTRAAKTELGIDGLRWCRTVLTRLLGKCRLKLNQRFVEVEMHRERTPGDQNFWWFRKVG